ncbi:hypothetical protein FH972_018400 [Carpinus fangiana]|uniref:Uncharacterized protein n=1 Tax=Carpinus fangiana TaxID=176857 RepID=A0A5N6RM04_9ROSI|nr:hypothetical protein FH972_018400 [Carpinus fangiana]
MLDPRNRTSSLSDGYDGYEARSYGSRARKTAQNYAKYNSWNGNGMEVRLAPEMKAIDDSGICSPPLWTTSPPRSPQHRAANHYRSLSPASRTQAIVRGQKELMEMVRNMPEACYELSLKDLVEQPFVEARQETVPEERPLYRRESSKKMNDKRVQARRSTGGIDGGGLYLKMGFPLSLGSRKSKQKNDQSVKNTSAKVSPKSPVMDGSVKGSVDKEWWKKRDGRGGCWSFFRTKKSKIQKPSTVEGVYKIITTKACNLRQLGNRRALVLVIGLLNWFFNSL